ncbi:MAG: carboxypeptidase-like regulatory domain-containing protein [Gemmatimonadota bacterium]
MRPRNFCTFLLVACAILPVVRPSRMYGQETAEPILIELQLGRLASRTVTALRLNRDVLVPLSEFFDLSEIHFQFSAPGVIDATLQPGDIHLIVNSNSDSLTFGKRHIAAPPETLRGQDGELFLSSSLLGSIINVRLVIDWSELNVTVADPERLPFGRRIAREAARSSLSAMESGAHPELALTLDRRHWNGLVFDYSFLSPASDAIGGGALATALGMDLLGGSLQMGLASEGRLDEGHTRTDLSWNGVWRQNRWVKQLRLGDGTTSGPRPRTVRGFGISNSPFQRPSLIGQVPYAGRLGPGWQIEAYRGGRLVAFDSADALGQFSVDVPVQYGENPVDFVAYGPFGEIREFNQTYRVVDNVLPNHQFEYGVSAGACRSDACNASANVDLRYGVSRRLTVQGGVDQFWRNGHQDLFHPYGIVSGALGNSWAVQVEGVANAVIRTGLAFEPSTDVRFSTEYNAFATHTVDPILTPAGRLRQWTTNAFFRPAPNRLSSMYVDGSLDLIESENGTSASTRALVSFQAAEIRMLPSLRIQRDAFKTTGTTTRTFFGLNTFILPRASLGQFMSAVTARTSMETDAGFRMMSAAGYVARPIGSGVRIETGLSWAREMGTSFSLFLSTTLSSVRAFSTLSAGPTGTEEVNYVQGSVLYDPDQRQIALASGPSVQRSGVSGQVFLDANGNGHHDSGEELLPDVRIRVGNISALSDSQGRYRVWDLLPFEPVLVVVDSASLPSPLWVPMYSAVSLEPGPNQFRDLDMPIAPGGLIEGRVIRSSDAGPIGIGGVTLFVTDRKTGVRRNVMTFSDGDFYLMGIKPGDYEITVAESVTSRLMMSADAVRFTMKASRDGESLEGLEVILRASSGDR